MSEDTAGGLKRAGRTALAAGIATLIQQLVPVIQGLPYGIITIPIFTALISGAAKWMREKWGLKLPL